MIDHFTLKVKNLEVSKAFYQAALAAVGKDNGAPSERKNYHVGYYAAFVIDPDRNNIEAVYHKK
ncbi:glyoxalase [Streptococcus anginosus]|nr:glyoxalase [Streptococcus anginosus]